MSERRDPAEPLPPTPSDDNPLTAGRPEFEWQPHSAAENALIRRRQRARAIVTALLLGALVILLFAISIAKIKGGLR